MKNQLKTKPNTYHLILRLPAVGTTQQGSIGCTKFPLQAFDFGERGEKSIYGVRP
jgi:hypothetical protein